jgi:hypothetical protein
LPFVGGRWGEAELHVAAAPAVDSERGARVPASGEGKKRGHKERIGG